MTRGRYAMAGLAALTLSCGRTAPASGDGGPVLGRFRLRTFPKGARVWVDGERMVDHTPATLVLPEGRYKLRIQIEGAEPLHTEIRIVGGTQREKTLNVPRPAPSMVSVRTDEVGARVRINGYLRGRSPLLEAVTKPGPLDVTVVSRSGQARAFAAELLPREHKEISLRFGDTASSTATEPGYLTVACDPPAETWTRPGRLPPRATAAIDAPWRHLGTTPIFQQKLAPGLHLLRLRDAHGQRTRVFEVLVPSRARALYRFTLANMDDATQQPPD